VHSDAKVVEEEKILTLLYPLLFPLKRKEGFVGARSSDGGDSRRVAPRVKRFTGSTPSEKRIKRKKKQKSERSSVYDEVCLYYFVEALSIVGDGDLKLSPLVTIPLGTLILTALATPWVFALCLYLFPSFHYPFSRVFDRVAMLSAVILIYVYRHELNLKGLYDEARFRFDTGEGLTPTIRGFLLALLTGTLAMSVLVETGELFFKDRTFQEVAIKILLIIPGALFIALVEEIFFRVILLARLIKLSGPAVGALLTSVLYALIHFIVPVKEFRYLGLEPFAGFSYLLVICERFLMPEIWAGLFGLFCVGSILNYVMIQTGSLALCVGLHAGWVTALKLTFFLTALPPHLEFNLALTRRYVFVAEPITWLSFVIVWAVLATIYIPRWKK
jgi:uncharacterized protein